jgi:uncharacterized membrane protein (UPF0127 family)
MIVFGNKVSGKDAVKGLMYIKKPLWNNNGMLFDMADRPKNHSMWMKNTYIPLDIIFLDENMNIVGYKENNIPHSLKQIKINKVSRYVLEMNSGSVKDNNLNINDKIYFINIKWIIIFLLIFSIFFIINIYK